MFFLEDELVLKLVSENLIDINEFVIVMFSELFEIIK